MFTAGYITSSTGAYFNDADKKTQVIQAGTWWDGSELAFNGMAKKSGDQSLQDR
ncbi:SipW-dependent-type signal peptide-containing protein [Virgibacillus salexigens]|uniref:SipW-dependent-type signal peptide-containing protein n=1 Tax=Virgibacillus salexigens TaxID=61016 RepID=UPI001F425074|nr:SipW-dependent-type signal peptide-containing protein [Virgibacillus salexigens]